MVNCRNILEQSCVVWDSALTQENISDMERTQKSFCKLVLQDKYDTYENSLFYLDLDSLENRRKILNTRFAEQGILNGNLSDLFPLNEKKYNLRDPEKYKVLSANTAKLQQSSIIQMQTLLNIKHSLSRKEKTEQKKRLHG